MSKRSVIWSLFQNHSAWFGDPHYLSRTSPHSTQCAWNSRIWNFEFWKTLLPLRNLWNFVPCQRFRPLLYNWCLLLTPTSLGWIIVKTEVFNTLCFTDFLLRKWTKEDLAEHKIQYVGYGVETCPDTKKVYHQGWLYAHTDVKRSFLLLAWKGGGR